MTVALATQIRFYQGSNDKQKWQNFFNNQSVDGYAYKAFDTSEILMNRSADEGGVTLTMVALKDTVDFFLAAIEGEYLAEILVYEFEVVSALPTSFAGGSVVARFVGEVQTMTLDLTQLTVSIGAAIDAVRGEIPGRRITTSLVGRLPTL